MTYQFYISTASSVSYQVYPLNWIDCSLVDEKEKGKAQYRRKFEGTLTFGGKKLCSDFNLFYGFEQTDPCEELYLIILRNGDSYWEGYFTTSMGDWDLDAGTFTITPLPLDDYVAFDQGGDTMYSILACTAVTSNMVYGPKATEYAFTRCRYLTDFIEYCASQICGATVTSSFLNDVNNYVTLTGNHYNLLTIAQKSDIIRWNSSNAATVAEMSWNELMDLLSCMNLKWIYDASTNVVRIEHISYWGAGPGLDIRTQELAIATNKYTYKKESLYKYESWSWMESGYDEFLPANIWYDSQCVNQDSGSNKNESAYPVTTDIQYILDCIDPDAPEPVPVISDEGFVLLANYLDGTDLQVYMTGRPLNNTYFNCDLGWGILLNAFFKHERMMMTGYVKGILTNFYSAVKNKLQQTAFIYCYDFNPDQYITTQLGELYFSGAKGYVDKATIHPDGRINLELAYGVPPIANTGFVYGKGMTITEVLTTSPDTTTYTAILTQPADADLTLQIRLVIEDSAHVMCATAYFDLDIATGATTGSVAIPWCDPGTPTYRIAVHQYVDAGLLDWDYTLVYDDNAFVY